MLLPETRSSTNRQISSRSAQSRSGLGFTCRFRCSDDPKSLHVKPNPPSFTPTTSHIPRKFE
ncbi:alanine racemase [Desmospora sp. 8437]|nr:alanine racemase [Desmospora sp. 8437]